MSVVVRSTLQNIPRLITCCLSLLVFGTAQLYISNVPHGFMPLTGSYILI